jgi:hypothetical protein
MPIPKIITASDVQQWSEDVVYLLIILSDSRAGASEAHAREFLDREDPTPTQLYELRSKLLGNMAERIVQMASRRNGGSYSETGSKTTRDEIFKLRDKIRSKALAKCKELDEILSFDSSIFHT